MAPTWLTIVAWIYLSVCFGCAAFVTWDIFINGRRQPMGVMNAVFPITALYFGPLALAFYLRWGRTASRPFTASTSVSRHSASEAAMTPASGRVHMDMAGTAGASYGLTEERGPAPSGPREKPWYFGDRPRCAAWASGTA
jgi:hypothetical protein